MRVLRPVMPSPSLPPHAGTRRQPSLHPCLSIRSAGMASARSDLGDPRAGVAPIESAADWRGELLAFGTRRAALGGDVLVPLLVLPVAVASRSSMSSRSAVGRRPVVFWVPRIVAARAEVL